MKRDVIVSILIKEGFSEKTLSKMSDKKIHLLANRILGEQSDDVINIPKEKTDSIRDAEQERKTFVTYENEGEIGEEEETTEAARTFANQNRPNMPKGTKFKAGRYFDKKTSQPYETLNEGTVKDWVEGLIAEHYHSMTTKNDILEVIKGKLMEQEPAVAPPKTKPKTTPKRDTPPQKDPYPAPFDPPEPNKLPDPTPKFEFPDFLKYDNIIANLNEGQINKITSLVMEKISKSLKKVQ